jgi:putative DNA primase/helicase
MTIPTRFDSMLPELKAVPHWVLAKLILKDGRWTKPPYQPNGRPASSTNPATWSSFESVREAFEGGDYLGVGFVLDGQPRFDGLYLHGFDWDDCIQKGPEGRLLIDPEVKASVKSLGIPRIEISVSGTGLRGFFLHHEALPAVRTKVSGRSVELYSTARYMTTTGVACVARSLK